MHDIQLQRFRTHSVTNHLAILELVGSFTGKPRHLDAITRRFLVHVPLNRPRKLWNMARLLWQDLKKLYYFTFSIL